MTLRHLTHEIVKHVSDNQILISGKCPGTGKTWELVVDKLNYASWLFGEKLIQQAFPDMSKDDRELMISGYTKEGWDMLFGKGE